VQLLAEQSPTHPSAQDNCAIDGIHIVAIVINNINIENIEIIL
jgi:hypothetical protein